VNAKEFKRRGRPARIPDNHPRPADEGDDFFFPANRAARRANPDLVGTLLSPQGTIRSLYQQTRTRKADGK
jgi:hypothetical protein